MIRTLYWVVVVFAVSILVERFTVVIVSVGLVDDPYTTAPLSLTISSNAIDETSVRATSTEVTTSVPTLVPSVKVSTITEEEPGATVTLAVSVPFPSVVTALGIAGEPSGTRPVTE